jgi:hypothetical protein
MDKIVVNTETTTLPERKFITEPARAEIIQLFSVFKDRAMAADRARQVWVEFLRTVRDDVGIKDNEVWNLAGDASYFERLPEGANQSYATMPPAQSAPELIQGGKLEEQTKAVESGEKHIVVKHPAPCQEDV